MSTVRASFGSPFGRKARIAVERAGARRQGEDRTGFDARMPSIRAQQNPLGKVPVLVLDDGTALFDSPRDPRISRSPRRRRQDHPEGRQGALRGAAVAGAGRRHHGCVDPASSTKAATGRRRSTSRNGSTCRTARSSAALAALEASPPGLDSPPDVGQITVACALGYRDFRFPGRWRDRASEAGGMARRLCRAGAGVRGDQAAAGVARQLSRKRKAPDRRSGALLFDALRAIRT